MGVKPDARNQEQNVDGVLFSNRWANREGKPRA